MVIAKLSCGNFGEDDLVATKREDGSVVLEIIAKDRSIRLHTVEPTDTLRVSSEIWGAPLPSMASELMIVSRCGSSTLVTHFELNAMWGGVHADEVGAFASAIADACGCGVNVLPTQERETTRTEHRPRKPSEPPPRPSYVHYVDRPGVEVIASVGYLNALQLPDGTVIVERLPTGVFVTVTAKDTLQVSQWHHSIGTPSIETWLARLGVSGTLGEFEWNLKTNTGIHTDEVIAFANAIADVTGCKVKLPDPDAAL